jgi:hypothetical protein
MPELIGIIYLFVFGQACQTSYHLTSLGRYVRYSTFYFTGCTYLTLVSGGFLFYLFQSFGGFGIISLPLSTLTPTSVLVLLYAG